ncbi:MAG: SDR family NAD(P)-dependent oxidoreductase [Balneolales bacterium]|nr:SDR family NAD(P)-dependent oxidoreductase [Balneolales bacterium]
MNEVSLSGKHIFITGASRGLGRSLAMKLHKTGAKLSLVSRTLKDLEDIKKELGDRVYVYGADLCSRNDADAAIKYLTYRNGPVDVLINNAGGGDYMPFGELTEKQISYTTGINIDAVMYLTHALLPNIKATKGSIVNVASDLARRPLANFAVYTAAKHAIAGFSQSLTRELAKDNVRVMLLNPGIIDTSFGGRKKGDIPPPHGLNADDVADVIHYMITRPSYLIMDEVTLHPSGQDF